MTAVGLAAITVVGALAPALAVWSATPPARRPADGPPRPNLPNSRVVARPTCGSLAPGWLRAAIVVLGVTVVVGPFVLPISLAAWWVRRRVRPIVDERRRLRSAEAALPDTVDLLVLMVRAGLTPHLAVREMARRAPRPTRSAFVEVGRRLDRGQPLADALVAVVDVAGPAFGSTVDAIASSERHGSPLGQVLDQLSHESRRRRRADADAHARTLPIRLSFPLVVCVLPAFVLVAIAPAVMAAISSLGSPSW